MKKNIHFRLLLIIFVALGSASCGFTPVHAPSSVTTAGLSDIIVAPPKNNRPNYIFVKELENRIGRNLNAGTILKHQVSVSGEGAGISTGAPRTRLVGRVTYEVVSVEDNRSLFRGSVDNFVAYVTDSNVTTALRNDAIERLMIILADQMATQLMARFSSLADE